MGFHKILLTVSLLLSAIISYAQVTTSGMNGKITGPNNEALPGATVVAVHTPSGSKYGTTTDAEGFYRLPNMNVGGPYTVTVSYIGYAEFKQDNVFLTLGQTFKLNTTLQESGRTIQEIEVVGQRGGIFDPNRKGAQTIVNRQQIDNMPTVGRNYTDFVRMTPQAKLTKDGSGNNAISIAGTNSRYNAIFVDGAVQNDVFGLAENGANGGQIGISPFSIDIIDQFNINVSPFDVKQGGFAGGAINAVTRRGSNEIEGSAYYFFRNQDLAGKTPTDDPKVEREKLANFTSKTYGARIGGPIIKNKLFYFFNVELQNDNTPQPFDYQTYATNRGSRAASRDELAQLTQKLNGLGYDPGGYENTIRELTGQKFFLRLDWNINDIHKFTIRHNYTRGHSISPGRSSANTITFANKGIDFTSTTNATTAELKSLFGNKASNSLLVGVNIVRDNRDPMGDRFPSVFISNESLSFGSEEFSTANLLNQDVITLTDNFELYKGRHTITIGTNNEYYNMTNVFIRQNYGSYSFANLDAFLNDQPAVSFNRSFSAVDDKTGDDTEGAAKFKAMKLSLYAQDDYQVSDRFKLSFGIRADLPFFLDNPATNTEFNENILPQVVAAGNWDIKGAKTGVKPDTRIMWSPRIAFNWDVKGDQTTQLRGGAGIFTSRIPFVWPGGMYNNNGMTVGGMSLRYDPSQPTSPTNQPITFNPNWNDQPSIEATPSGQIDLFAKDFKFPQVFRASLAVDQKLPWGMVGTLEGIYTKNINNVNYFNLSYINSGQTVTGNGGDHRTIWENVGSAVRGNYTDIMFADNTSEGYSYNITAQLQKAFNNGLSATAAYTYGSAKSVNDGQSSQNSSQWRVPNVNGRNAAELGYSVYDMGHRIIASVTYRKDYAKHFGTSVTLFYTGQSGDRFSYGYRDVPAQNVVKDYTGSSSDKGLNLIYIPRTASDINLVDYTEDDGTVVTAAEQWAALNNFIENDKYLSKHRGEYAEKNGTRAPFTNIFDLHLEQNFYLSQRNGKTHTLQLTFDVFNLGNMLNKDWGRIYTTRSGMSYNNYGLIDFIGFAADGTTPQYNFSSPHKNDDKTVAAIDDAGFQTSRWQSQIGIRYIFH
ncbi:TonB-dependent receptor [Chitinophaga japonensis]|uniref:TonB-dependent receptor-like protein n=1 Tax=Chitinophaga japonensis TaxID=104662 RepID=A0A562T673_CHIJA|nr:carboxypeptidase regulatory-like domain-containing protein [Chitinophaga japonensis]TWI88853.1 TonB-dependent receptor-like protein [Chitinophaga japonensis]